MLQLAFNFENVAESNVTESTLNKTDRSGTDDLETYIKNFSAFGTNTESSQTTVERNYEQEGNNDHYIVPTYTNEFWTSKQRGGHSLHEISYRACFKSELPDFFIDKLTEPGDIVYDPFLGRGTTALQAALRGRIAYGCDINPISKVLAQPRLAPPTSKDIKDRLNSLDLTKPNSSCYRDDLEVFYHPETLNEICNLRDYFLNKGESLDTTDKWLQMVCVNRLTGHSSGFFSVYTLPPNQAVSIDSQKRINKNRNQVPTARDVKSIILKKSKNLLQDSIPAVMYQNEKLNKLICGNSQHTPEIPDESVTLVVTSPPFLDVVQYAIDNWLRCWFIGIDAKDVKITIAKKVENWELEMAKTFKELHRVLKKNGHIAFEVGEVKNGRVLLEKSVVRAAISVGLSPQFILINAQEFTKTANIWGVDNQKKGTNTNRIVILKKECNRSRG